MDPQSIVVEMLREPRHGIASFPFILAVFTMYVQHSEARIARQGDYLARNHGLWHASQGTGQDSSRGHSSPDRQ